MKVKIVKGTAKVAGEYVHEGDVAHVEDEAGKDLIARGVAVRVQRATRVGLNLNADDQEGSANGK